MSVYKSKRGESSIQFIEVARKIECHTLEQCLKVPKRYTFLLTTRIMSLASDVYDHVVSANSIYPTNQHEAQTRRDHLIAANAALRSLDVSSSSSPESSAKIPKTSRALRPPL